MMHHNNHDVKPSDLKTTLVNIPQLETLKALATEQEQEINDGKKRERERVVKYNEIHADIYDRLDKLQLQLQEKDRNEASLVVRVKKSETRIHYLESIVGDIDKIGKMEDRVRHLESQFRMEAPSPFHEHISLIKSLQRSIHDVDNKTQEALAQNNQSISMLAVRINNFEEGISALRLQLSKLEEKKAEREDVESALAILTDKNRELQVKIATNSDHIDELTRKLQDISAEFHGELDVQRKRIDGELNICNTSILDLRTNYDAVKIKLSSLEALIETVGIMERQIEDWNTERNRLNDKVDTVLQRRLRELDRMVQQHEINKMDRFEVDKKIELFMGSFVTKEEFDKYDIVIEKLASRNVDIDTSQFTGSLSALDVRVGQLDGKFEQQDALFQALVMRFEEMNKKLAESVKMAQEATDIAANAASRRKASIIAPATTVVAVEQTPQNEMNFDIDLWNVQYEEISKKFASLEDLRLSVEHMRQDLHKLSLRVAELNTLMAKLQVDGHGGGGGGAIDGNAFLELKRRLETVEHVKIEKEYLKKQLWAVLEQLRKEVSNRVEKLAYAAGGLIDDVRSDQGTLAREIQKWIKNFLKQLSAASNDAGAAYNDNPAAMVRCLVCKREPAFNIDYTSPDLAFKPAQLLNAIQHGPHSAAGAEPQQYSAHLLLNGDDPGGGGRTNGNFMTVGGGVVMHGRGLEGENEQRNDNNTYNNNSNNNNNAFMRQTYAPGQFGNNGAVEVNTDHGNLRGHQGYGYGAAGAVTGASPVPKKRPGSAPSYRRSGAGGGSSGSGFNAVASSRKQ